MSVIEKSGSGIYIRPETEEKKGPSLFTQFVELISSVRFGIILLIIVGLFCFLGMIIMQQNVDGFDRYYADLTPAQKLVYGWLGLFDIYHVWYFNAALLVLSLNVILSSVERFPKTWTFVSRRKLDASEKWLKGQEHHADVELTAENVTSGTDTVVAAMHRAGWKNTTVTEKNGRTFVFAERGRWNRFGYLAVHVGLLVIFAGGFMTGQLGSTGSMAVAPGRASNEMYETVSNLDQLSQITKRLPFDVYCTDIQQKLIKDDGSLSAMNTIDWLTKIQIRDGEHVEEAVVQMNRPFDYRGYRFFQSSFVALGRAREIKVAATSAASGAVTELTLPRDGVAQLADGTEVKFAEFRGNFSLGKENPNEDTSGYPNPAAVLQITAPGGKTETAYAFGEKLANIPVASKPIGGYTFRMNSFEKVGDQHILSVQRDPGADVVYVGFVILCLTLVAVFFFAHQRVWALIEKSAEDDKFKVVLGGNTNRNQSAFGEQFQRLVANLRGA